MRKLPNPPKSKRLTKRVGLEAMMLLDMLEYNVAVKGWVIPDREWLRMFYDRMCDCRANLHAWHEAEKEKVKCRKHNNKENDNEKH